MSLDLLIRGGTIIDGTGAPARQGDIGVREGRIVEMGKVSTSAARTLDADGAVVTPGFVDIHTHYDGQASWDADLLPSAAHGVTTAVMGNCGVGFAPCRPSDRDRLIKLFEGVEDIPGSALSEGISWSWETFGEYLDSLDRTPRTMDVAAYLTHDALRIFTMGDRAIANAQPTEDDLRTMEASVAEAMRVGAIGFSTGRTDNHRAIDGSPTPASEASIEELERLARAMGRTGRGVLQAVSDFDMDRGGEHFDREFDVIERFAAAAEGRPISVSLMQRDLIPTQWEQILERAEKANQTGLKFRVQVAPRGIGVLLGLEATFHPFVGFPSYKRISHLTLGERVRHMRDASFRAQLLSETSDRIAGDGSPVPPLADRLLASIDLVSMRMFRFTPSFDYEPKPGDSLMALAMAQNKRPLEVIYDAMLEDDGKALIYFPLFNYSGMNLDVVETMLHHPLAIVGLGDGGAHCGTICDASMPTFFLKHWVRDRPKGRFSLERAVEMLTKTPAHFLGLHDRGTLALGKRADFNVLDLGALDLDRPHLVHDLPAGGKRLLQSSSGYRATIVAGRIVSANGALTGERPGRVVRASA